MSPITAPRVDQFLSDETDHLLGVAINYGSDYSEAMLEEARNQHPDLNFEQQDLTQLSYSNDRFDVVMLSGVLEHVPSYTAAISEACRVASRYVLVHRCPMVLDDRHEINVLTQYGIQTQKIFFARQPFVDQFEANGYHLIHEVPTYPPHPTVWKRQLKAQLRRVAPLKIFAQHEVNSLLFERTGS